MEWIAQHIGAVLSATAAASAAAGWVSRHLGLLSGVVEKGVSRFDSDVLGRIHSPVVKAFLVKVEKAADEAIPGAGDAKYAALATLVMYDLPPSAAPFTPVLKTVLEAIGTGAKAGLEETPPAKP